MLLSGWGYFFFFFFFWGGGGGVIKSDKILNILKSKDYLLVAGMSKYNNFSLL